MYPFLSLSGRCFVQDTVRVNVDEGFSPVYVDKETAAGAENASRPRLRVVHILLAQAPTSKYSLEEYLHHAPLGSKLQVWEMKI